VTFDPPTCPDGFSFVLTLIKADFFHPHKDSHN
jgi:hypothetical protein